jgi:hypothetical protein
MRSSDKKTDGCGDIFLVIIPFLNFGISLLGSSYEGIAPISISLLVAFQGEVHPNGDLIGAGVHGE